MRLNLQYKGAKLKPISTRLPEPLLNEIKEISEDTTWPIYAIIESALNDWKEKLNDEVKKEISPSN